MTLHVSDTFLSAFYGWVRTDASGHERIFHFDDGTNNSIFAKAHASDWLEIGVKKQWDHQFFGKYREFNRYRLATCGLHPNGNHG